MTDTFPNAEENYKQVEQLLAEPENKKCADCTGSSADGYICLDFGTFVCFHCAEILRSNKHKVKKISPNNIRDEDLAVVKENGNRRSYDKWLVRYTGDHPEPSNTNDRKYRTDYLKLKYEDKKWARHDAAPIVVEYDEINSSSGRNRSTSSPPAFSAPNNPFVTPGGAAGYYPPSSSHIHVMQQQQLQHQLLANQQHLQVQHMHQIMQQQQLQQQQAALNQQYMQQQQQQMLLQQQQVMSPQLTQPLSQQSLPVDTRVRSPSVGNMAYNSAGAFPPGIPSPAVLSPRGISPTTAAMSPRDISPTHALTSPRTTSPTPYMSGGTSSPGFSPTTSYGSTGSYGPTSPFGTSPVNSSGAPAAAVPRATSPVNATTSVAAAGRQRSNSKIGVCPLCGAGVDSREMGKHKLKDCPARTASA